MLQGKTDARLKQLGLASEGNRQTVELLVGVTSSAQADTDASQCAFKLCGVEFVASLISLHCCQCGDGITPRQALDTMQNDLPLTAIVSAKAPSLANQLRSAVNINVASGEAFIRPADKTYQVASQGNLVVGHRELQSLPGHIIGEQVCITPDLKERVTFCWLRPTH